MKQLLPRLHLSAALAALSLTAGLRAQTAPAAPSPATKNPAEVVQLSEFQVSETSSNGYIASETMTGSRVNTKIIDLPYSVVNLTSEFFNDFGIDLLDENLTYIGGFTGLSIGGGFNLRGFASTSQLRDGFYRLGRYGSSSVDRLEIIEGSEAGIYGRSSPGGMVNMISKQPKKTETESLTLRDGGYDQRAARLEMTGPLSQDHNTYYVLTLAQPSRHYDGMFGHFRNNEAYGAIRHDFADGSHLQVQAEYFLNYNAGTTQSAAPVMSVPRTATPDNSATTTAVGYDTALAAYSPFGPDASVNRGSTTFLISYDKKISDVWSFRQGIQDFRARAWSYNNAGWAAFTIPATGAPTDARSATPQFGRIMEDGGGSQSDLVAHYGLFNGKVDNKSLFTVDFNDYYRWDPTFNYSSSTNPFIAAWSGPRSVPLSPVTIDGVTNYIPNPGIPINYFTQPVSSMWAQGPTISTLTRRRTTQLGGNFNQQMFLFDKHLILYAGLRVDNVRSSERDYTVAFASVGFNNLPPGTGGLGQPGQSVVRRYFHQRRPNVGFNYAVTEHWHVFGSYSESYFYDQTLRPQPLSLPTFQPQIAKGFDYGIKGSFFDGRLNFTLDGYYANQYNVTVNEDVILANGTISTTSVSDGDQVDKGAEFNMNWRATESLTLVASFGTVNAKYSDFGTASPEAIGRSVQNQTPENGSVISRYDFRSGSLKGLSVGTAATYVASTPGEAPNAGDTVAVVNGKLQVTAHTDQWKLRIPSFTLWQFNAHYMLPRFSPGWDQNIGLVLNNAFGRTNFLKTSKNFADDRNILFTYTLTHSKARY